MHARFNIFFLSVLLLPRTLAGDAIRGEDGLVLFLQTHRAPAASLAVLGHAPVQMLNDAADGRQVAVVGLEAGWRHTLPRDRAHTLEVMVLEGQLNWEGHALDAYDYAYLPSRSEAPDLAVGEDGARLLIFLDPPRSTDGEQARLMDTQATPWRPGVVSQRDTGQALDLEVKDLLWVEGTGQRTWLVRLGTDFQVPWEVHDGAEEGFLLEGDYHMGECLADGPVHGAYAAGGYFYRPGSIAHSGPDSGSYGGALWLLRSPVRLTVAFLDACP